VSAAPCGNPIAGLLAFDLQIPRSRFNYSTKSVTSGGKDFRPCCPAIPLELGKSWHMLHYLFTGHVDASAAPGNALLAGARLGEDLGFGPPRLHDERETRDFARFLEPRTCSGSNRA
jgi:Domain of unknown function (DUF1877)